MIGYLITAGLGHYNIFGKRTFGLTRTAQKLQLTAGMRPAGQALVALKAWLGRLDRNPVPGLYMLHPGPHLFNDPAALMADYKWIFYPAVPDMPFIIQMHI